MTVFSNDVDTAKTIASLAARGYSPERIAKETGLKLAAVKAALLNEKRKENARARRKASANKSY